MNSTVYQPVQDATIRKILQSPRLPQLSRQFQDVLESEREKRERFYVEMREDQKVEFINGEVVVQSPIKLRHSEASERLLTLLKVFVNKHRLGWVGHEKLLVSLTRNDYEPDIIFYRQNRSKHFLPDQMIFPAPDFVVEVLSPSTEEIDRGVKFEDYAAHEIAEYWIADPENETVEQYGLPEGEETYELLVKVKTGPLQSTVITGFEIPTRAIFDDVIHLETMQTILE